MLLSIVFLSSFFSVDAGKSKNKLQCIHREIGHKLICIKRDHPKAKVLVYSVLDKLGKYYTFSKELIAKKKKYKSLVKAEISHSEKLKKDKDELDTKMERMKSVMLVVNKKLKTDFADIDVIRRERDEFLKEKERLELEKKQLITEKQALLQEREMLLQEGAQASAPAQESGQDKELSRRENRPAQKNDLLVKGNNPAQEKTMHA